MRYVLTTLLTLLAAAAFVFGQSTNQPTEAELEALVRQAPKLHYHKLIEFNEQKLDRVFHAQLEVADEELKEALNESQRKWREFYDAERFVGAIKNRGGSGSYPATAGRRLHLLRVRIHQLAVPYLQGWPQVPRVQDPKHLKQNNQMLRTSYLSR